MQARQIFGALEILSAQLDNLAVVPPDEEADDSIEEVCANGVRPKLRTRAKLRCHLYEYGDLGHIHALILSLGWIVAAALAPRHHGFLWALLLVVLWAVLLVLYQRATVSHAQAIAARSGKGEKTT